MKTKLFYLLFSLFFFSNITSAKSIINSKEKDVTTTAIPDAAFEQELINLGYDSGVIDGSVITANIASVTTLNLSYLGIEQLDGIEDFAALENLTFQGNNANIITLNLPTLANLKILYVGNFPNLNSIDVSNLALLEDATFQGLTSFVSLDVSSNSNLLKLNVSGSTNLATLNFTNLMNLEELSLVNSTAITSLDFSTLTGLKKIHLQDYTALSTIITNNLANLEMLSTAGLSSITSIDLSTNTGLKNLILTNSTQLSFLSIKSGNTATIDYVQLFGNTLLTCVEVDAGVPLNGISTWNQNNGYIFNEDCSNPETYVPDDNFEAFLEANAMGNGTANDDKVFTNNINTIAVLDVSNQSISDLTGIEDFTVLTELDAKSNSISEVNISKNLNLEKLILNSNQLSEINVSENTLLEDLWIKDNTIKILDVSKNVALNWLDCSENDIENLNLNANTALSYFIVNNNNLAVLKLQNGYSVASFDARNNPNLTCVEVLDVSFWASNYGSQIDSQTSFSSDCNYPETNVPDAAFENYLETHDRDGNLVAITDPSNMGNGVANDMKVFTHRINTIKKLVVDNVGLSSLTGLEDFRDVEIFSSFGGNSSLSSADFSNNLKLKRITFTFNSNATNVTFGNLPNVEYIQLGYNNIASVDISGLPNLDEFKDINGKLTSLDTSGNPNLRILTLNTNLIISLDLSSNNLLERLYASNNQLTSLNINNGANNLIPTATFEITNNPNLTCIEVSNVSYANTNWTTIDSQHTFNTDCSSVWAVMTNPATTTALLAVTPSIDTNNDGVITIAEAAAYTGAIDLSGSGISDVEGLQAFTSITTLNISGNGITDISPLTGLSATIIQRNTGVAQNAATGTMALEELIVNDNNLEGANLNGLPNLKIVDLSNNPDLITVSIQNTNNANITSFNATNSPKLTCILVDDINAGYLSTWTIDSTAGFASDEADCLNRVLSINDFNIEKYISVYPNPVKDYLEIKVSNDLEIKKIEIFNLLGKIIRKTTLPKVSFEGINNGIYLVKIKTDKGIILHKIIKE